MEPKPKGIEEQVTPEEMFDDLVAYYRGRFTVELNDDLTDQEKYIRALGETYNNWFFRLPRPDGMAIFGQDSKQLQRVNELLTEFEVDRDELKMALEKLYCRASPENPVVLDIDRLTKPVVLEMVRRYGYSLNDLFS